MLFRFDHAGLWNGYSGGDDGSSAAEVIDGLLNANVEAKGRV